MGILQEPPKWMDICSECKAEIICYDHAKYLAWQAEHHGACKDKPKEPEVVEPKGAAKLAYNIELRDLFAANVMPALMNGAAIAFMSGQAGVIQGGVAKLDLDALAAKSYEVADALVKARG